VADERAVVVSVNVDEAGAETQPLAVELKPGVCLVGVRVAGVRVAGVRVAGIRLVGFDRDYAVSGNEYVAESGRAARAIEDANIANRQIYGHRIELSNSCLSR